MENLWHDYFLPTSLHLPPELPHSLVQTQNLLSHVATQVYLQHPKSPPNTCKSPQNTPKNPHHLPRPSVTPPTLLLRIALKHQLQPKIIPSSSPYLPLMMCPSITLLTSPLSLNPSPKFFSCVYFKSTTRWTFLSSNFSSIFNKLQVVQGNILASTVVPKLPDEGDHALLLRGQGAATATNSLLIQVTDLRTICFHFKLESNAIGGKSPGCQG